MVSVAKFDQWQSTAGVVRGTVLQVVNATYGTQTSSTSSTYADTGLTATITPTSVTSKILVLVVQSGVQKNGADTTVPLRLLRGSTEIIRFDRVADTSSTASVNIGAAGCTYLDSPSTTSATTYKTQFRTSSGTGTVYTQAAGGVGDSNSTITLMEIAA